MGATLVISTHAYIYRVCMPVSNTVTTGQRRDRLHRQRHRAVRQLSAPAPSTYAFPCAKPHFEHPGQYLVKHTKPDDLGSDEEQVD